MAEDITTLRQAISQYETQVIIRCTYAVLHLLVIFVYILPLEREILYCKCN